jgi:hypothetical protein
VRAHAGTVWRSTGALLAGLITIVGLSLITDQILHSLDVYPPWGEPMHEPELNALALVYRCVYAVIGCYLAARLAPSAPMRHAMMLGAIGLLLSTAGAAAAIDMNLGPSWYPIALALSSIPCAWIGGVLHRARHREPRA